MKKYLVILGVIFSLSCQGQSKNYTKHHKDDMYDFLDQRDYYGITLEQKRQIIAKKKSLGRQMAEISNDRSLSGYEKGQKKRQLSLDIQNDIRDILNQGQINVQFWDDQSSNENWNVEHKDRFNDELEQAIDLLEDQYERDIEYLERRYPYDKQFLKQEKQYRKAIYKAEKNRLKSLKK